MKSPISLPYVKKPCGGCPFLKDTISGWLGEERMTDITNSSSFCCHKTTDTTNLQCAGHMLLMEHNNGFVNLAERMNIPLQLSGREKVFDTVEDCIKHHSED